MHKTAATNQLSFAFERPVLDRLNEPLRAEINGRTMPRGSLTLVQSGAAQRRPAADYLKGVGDGVAMEAFDGRIFTLELPPGVFRRQGRPGDYIRLRDEAGESVVAGQVIGTVTKQRLGNLLSGGMFATLFAAIMGGIAYCHPSSDHSLLAAGATIAMMSTAIGLGVTYGAAWQDSSSFAWRLAEGRRPAFTDARASR